MDVYASSVCAAVHGTQTTMGRQRKALVPSASFTCQLHEEIKLQITMLRGPILHMTYLLGTCSVDVEHKVVIARGGADGEWMPLNT